MGLLDRMFGKRATKSAPTDSKNEGIPNRPLTVPAGTSGVTKTLEQEVKALTDDELRVLPRWALVAFAARCARRVHPYILRHWPSMLPAHAASIEEAMKYAETASQRGSTDGLSDSNAAVAGQAEADAGMKDPALSAVRAAITAYGAAEIAQIAQQMSRLLGNEKQFQAQIAEVHNTLVRQVAKSVGAAYDAAIAADKGTESNGESVVNTLATIASFRADHSLIAGMSKARKWVNDSAASLPPLDSIAAAEDRVVTLLNIQRTASN